MNHCLREFRPIRREPWGRAEWLALAIIACMGALILAEVW